MASPVVSLRATHVTVPASFDRRALLDAAFQSTPDLVALLVRDGRVLDANRSALEFAQVTLEEAQRTPLWDLPGWSAHPALTSWLRSAVAHAVTGFTNTHGGTVAMPGGATRMMQFTLRVLTGGEPTPDVLHLTATELPDLYFRETFKSSSAIQLMVHEQTGALLDANPAAEAFYGWSAESMRSMIISDLADTTLEAWRAEWPLETAERVSTVLHRHRVADGQPRDVEIAASRIQFDGHSVRHLIVHDVSDRTRAEAELRESEARFRAVINGMSEGVVIHDASGAIRAFNPEAERILGLSGAQLLGLQPIDRDWQAVREDGTEWPASQHPAMQALRSGRTQERALMGIRRGAAEDVWLQVTADPLVRPGESIPYAAVAVFSDVTARRSAEERLRQAQKLEAVGQLAGGIAHDFNNLLTVIRGASGFLRDAVPQHSPLLDDIQSIERATVRAEELTRRLLAVGRRQMLRTETVDLRALVQEQFPAIREATSRTIRVQAQLGETSVPARLDRRQVLDALRALVDNARAAMPTGGTLTLSTGIRRLERPETGVPDGDSREFAMLEVRDTGAGMGDEVRARLFEPFFSTQPFGANHGMGLASVHGMVAQSHGYIECDSAPGEGTSLRLYFPCAATPETVATPPTGATAVTSRGILLVDDDPMLRDLARRMLERLGHSVAAVASGHDALDVLSLNGANVAVLVTDLTMPGMSGLELIDATQRLYPHLPIVAISGFSMHPSAREDLASRRVVYLGKPFQAGELASALERALAAAVAE